MTRAQQASHGFWTLIGLSLIGFWPIIVFTIGVAFLVWVVRLVVVAWVGSAIALRWACFAVWDRVIGS